MNRHLFGIVVILISTLASADGGAIQQQIAQSARQQIGQTLFYDPAYVRLDYPGGDVALDRGVCTDVVIRSLRGVDIDLQQLIHEDMSANFSRYPRNWGLSRPDRNIDHRRVPNIITYYQRQGRSLPLPLKPESLRTGDLVTWMLPGNLPHIGVVSSVEGDDVLIVHNIGRGAREERVLHHWPITAHLRPAE